MSSLITTLLGELAAIERQGIIDRLNSGRELYSQKGGRLGRKPGSRKTAEQRKEEYREAIALLKKGYSIRNVAKLTGKASLLASPNKNIFHEWLLKRLCSPKTNESNCSGVFQ